MKKSALEFDLDAECNFSDLPPERIETACKYEYMRESQVLRDALTDSGDHSMKASRRRQPLPLLGLRRGEKYGLALALLKAGFPKPWKRLTDDSQKELILPISEFETERKKSNPPVVIEEASIVPDLDRALERRPALRLEPSQPELLRKWGRPDETYFFGFIRIDESYNETEAGKAFKAWFRERYGNTKGGGGPKWRNQLKQLAVMRIWKHERDRWKRLKLVAKFCGYKGCREEMADYKKRCQEGRGDEPMSKAAKVEISSARAEARKLFQRLFPGEEPLSY